MKSKVIFVEQDANRKHGLGRPMFPGGRTKNPEQRARLRELLLTDSKDNPQIEPPQPQTNLNNRDRRVCNMV